MQEGIINIFPALEEGAGICYAKEGGKRHEHRGTRDVKGPD